MSHLNLPKRLHVEEPLFWEHNEEFEKLAAWYRKKKAQYLSEHGGCEDGFYRWFMEQSDYE